MAPEVKAQPDDQQARREQIVSEWANAGWCAGMLRARSHALSNRPRPASLEADRENWQPNQRCCP